MIDCRLSISSRGDGWTSDNVLRASMEISDNFATVAYKLEGDDCLLTLSPERAEQVRRGGADIKLSFVPNAKTVCVIGDEALRGGYEIFCTRLSVLINRRGVAAEIEYLSGGDGEKINVKIRAVALSGSGGAPASK